MDGVVFSSDINENVNDESHFDENIEPNSKEFGLCQHPHFDLGYLME